jgi:hypothetical protein
MKWMNLTNGDHTIACTQTLDGDILVRSHHSRTLKIVDENDHFVVFVRSPLKKFVSGFISRLREGRPLFNTPHTDAERVTYSLYQDPESLAIDLYHKHEQIRDIARKCMKSVIHLRMSFQSYFESISNLDTLRDRILFVGRTENMKEDFDRLQSVINLPAVTLTTDPVLAHATPPEFKAKKKLSSQARHNILRYYAEDYILIAKLMKMDLLPPDYLEDEFEELNGISEYQSLAHKLV